MSMLIPVRSTEPRPARQPLGVEKCLSLLFATTLALGTFGQARAQDTRTWTGAVNAFWSTPGNWSPAGVPVDGDSLVFPPDASEFAPVNDLPVGLEVHRMMFTGGGYQLAGNGIVLTESVLSESNDGNRLSLPINVQSHAVALHSANTNPLILDAPLSGTGPVVTAMEDAGWSHIVLEGSHPYSGTLTVPNGVGHLRLNAVSLAAAQVLNHYRIAGNGLLGSLSQAAVGELAPGPYWASFGNNNGIGRIQVGQLSLSGGLSIDLAGAAPGVGYDQVVATGDVSLDQVQLFLYLEPSFAPALGQSFVVIDNQGSDSIDGVFIDGNNAPLPEGSTIALGAYEFQLSYVGGDGNDVVLTSLSGLQSTQTSLLSTPNPSLLGEEVSFTATVAAQSGSPAGDVLFRDGSNLLATVALIDGQAHFTSVDLPAGPRAITAEYAGTPDFGASASSVLTQVVRRLADVSVTADDGRTEAAPRGDAAYLIEVRNAGPSDAPGTELIVVVHPALVGAEWTCAPVGSAICPALGGSGEILQTLTLPAGAGMDFVLSGEYAATLPTTVLMQAEAQVASDAPHYVEDPNPGNNTASDSNTSTGVFADGFESSGQQSSPIDVKRKRVPIGAAQPPLKQDLSLGHNAPHAQHLPLVRP
jgi:hypothetical protein